MIKYNSKYWKFPLIFTGYSIASFIIVGILTVIGINTNTSFMIPFINGFINTIPKECPITISISGGSDSMLCLFVAKKLGLNEGKIGFRKDDVTDYEKQVKSYEIYNQASHEVLSESLIEYGMSTEFVGRIQSIVPLIPLNREQMRYCLTELDL